MHVAILVVALALSASAEAHDLDCHGMPVPRAEKLGCCGAGDAHFGGTSQFYEDHDGFWHYLVAGDDFLLVRGAPENMTKIQPLPSAEGLLYGLVPGVERQQRDFRSRRNPSRHEPG
jgi:hypothetical protein